MPWKLAELCNEGHALPQAGKDEPVRIPEMKGLLAWPSMTRSWPRRLHLQVHGVNWSTKHIETCIRQVHKHNTSPQMQMFCRPLAMDTIPLIMPSERHRE